MPKKSNVHPLANAAHYDAMTATPTQDVGAIRHTELVKMASQYQTLIGLPQLDVSDLPINTLSAYVDALAKSYADNVRETAPKPTPLPYNTKPSPTSGTDLVDMLGDTAFVVKPRDILDVNWTCHAVEARQGTVQKNGQSVPSTYYRLALTFDQTGDILVYVNTGGSYINDRLKPLNGRTDLNARGRFTLVPDDMLTPTGRMNKSSPPIMIERPTATAHPLPEQVRLAIIESDEESDDSEDFPF